MWTDYCVKGEVRLADLSTGDLRNLAGARHSQNYRQSQVSDVRQPICLAVRGPQRIRQIAEGICGPCAIYC
jgi:hypothetical protein